MKPTQDHASTNAVTYHDREAPTRPSYVRRLLVFLVAQCYLVLTYIVLVYLFVLTEVQGSIVLMGGSPAFTPAY